LWQRFQAPSLGALVGGKEKKQIERMSVDSDVAVLSMDQLSWYFARRGVTVFPGPKILDGCPDRRRLNVDADCATVF
jgi:hypothetical protein